MEKVGKVFLVLFVAFFLVFMGWMSYENYKIGKRWDEVKKTDWRFGWSWKRGDPIENLPPFLRDQATKVCTTYWIESELPDFTKEEMDSMSRYWDRKSPR